MGSRGSTFDKNPPEIGLLCRGVLAAIRLWRGNGGNRTNTMAAGPMVAGPMVAG